MGIFDRNDDNNSSKSTPKADFSDVQGGSSSTAPAPIPSDIPVSPAGKRYTLVACDSLSRIPVLVCGDPHDCHRQSEPNRDIRRDPDPNHTGQALATPPKA